MGDLDSAVRNAAPDRGLLVKRIHPSRLPTKSADTRDGGEEELAEVGEAVPALRTRTMAQGLCAGTWARQLLQKSEVFGEGGG